MMAGMELTFDGVPLDRKYELTFDVSMTEDGARQMRKYVGVQDRELRITLQPGQRFPDAYKRGQTVRFDFGMGPPFVGRVKYRRLNRLVCIGR